MTEKENNEESQADFNNWCKLRTKEMNKGDYIDNDDMYGIDNYILVKVTFGGGGPAMWLELQFHRDPVELYSATYHYSNWGYHREFDVPKEMYDWLEEQFRVSV